jgi:alpha-N-arabinofuranosidase
VERKTLINRWNYKVEDNSFGTHEFLDLCEEIEAEPYLVMNVGSSTVREIAEWVEYITFSGDTDLTRLRRKNGRNKPWNLKYICMGNEWWFFEDAAGYTADFKRYNNFTRDYGPIKMKRLLRGPQHYDYRKTGELSDHMEPGSFDAMTLYQIILQNSENDWNKRGSPLDFTDEEYFASLNNALIIDESITRHLDILKKKGNKNVRLAIDEWGTWYNDEGETLWFMRPAMRDALIQATVLNIFNQRSNALLLCSLSMSVNALSSIMLTEGEKMIKNPAFYVFRMYKGHQGAELLRSCAEDNYIDYEGKKLPQVSHSASIKDKTMLITLVNCSPDKGCEINCKIFAGEFRRCEAEILHSGLRDTNTFKEPFRVVPQPYREFKLNGGSLTVTLPKCSVTALRLSP